MLGHVQIETGEDFSIEETPVDHFLLRIIRRRVVVQFDPVRKVVFDELGDHDLRKKEETKVI